MGIKGIYAEIGQGKRVSLSKLAIESIENKGRPLRIAIDVSIWQFQNQAGKGGSNPALRTLYYRLLRLLSKSIQPLFVFDGPNKPPIKRNKRTGIGGPSITDSITKELLKLFGFPFHVAPGEAEAECALLQREAIVDAVLSEDVDTLMFGCGITFRNWSSEKAKGNHTPTHVSVYDAKDIQERKPGLDREGMVLVALMSGGDYDTEGILQCGIKLACEAARAGFGKSLCRISRSDNASMEKWRAELTHELHTNEKKYFRVKHKSLKILNSFPDREVLGYYTHPVVSSANKIARLKDCIRWDEVNIPCLQAFVATAFAWVGLFGTHKFMRGLAPALLPEKLRNGQTRTTSRLDDTTLVSGADMEIVRAICGQRYHFSTDGISELRLSYYPVDVLGLGLSTEVDSHEDYGRDGLAPFDEDGEILLYESEEDDQNSTRSRSASPIKRSEPRYDPTALQKAWLPETIAKIGIPLIFEDYEESQRNPRKIRKGKVAVKTAATKGGMPRGSLERYITITKPKLDSQSLETSKDSKKLSSKDSNHPPTFPAPNSQQNTPPLQETRLSCKVIQARNINPSKDQNQTTRPNRPEFRPAAKKRNTASGNPWTTAQTSSDGSHNSPHFRVHVSKPVVTSDRSLTSSLPQKFLKESDQVHYCLDSSVLSQPPRRKHSRSVTPTSSVMKSSNSPKPSLTIEPSLVCSPISSALSAQEMTSSTAHNPTSPLRLRQPLHNAHPARKPFRGEKKSRAACFQGTPVVYSPEVEIDLPSLSHLPSESSTAYHTPATSDLIQDRSNKPIYVAHTSPSPAKGASETSESPKMKPFEVAMEQKSSRKRFVMLRNSVEGVWKEVSDGEGKQAHEKGRSRAWRASVVEVLDMTSDEVAWERMQ